MNTVKLAGTYSILLTAELTAFLPKIWTILINDLVKMFYFRIRCQLSRIFDI